MLPSYPTSSELLRKKSYRHELQSTKASLYEGETPEEEIVEAFVVFVALKRTNADIEHVASTDLDGNGNDAPLVDIGWG